MISKNNYSYSIVFCSVLAKVSIYFPAHYVFASVFKITASSAALNATLASLQRSIAHRKGLNGKKIYILKDKGERSLH